METILIIGGSGFIGSNLADFYFAKGNKVIIFDNLSRDKVEYNLNWLQKKYNGKIVFIKGDIVKDTDLLSELMEKVDVVFHFAGQVAVTASIEKPKEDFSINLVGTINILEAIRCSKKKPILLYSSTNKVYGSLKEVITIEKEREYCYKEKKEGISEEQPLDFHSPYGCSKGAADQYVRDYARVYNLKTIVFRQSCIYGHRQFGKEEQGWVAWFVIAALQGKSITIYGTGKQVRDILFIEDLCEAYAAAVKQIDKTQGQIYNIGGGPENSISILSCLALLEQELQQRINCTFAPWRPGDQLVFVSNIQKAKRDFNWLPKTSPQEGIKMVVAWAKENKELL